MYWVVRVIWRKAKGSLTKTWHWSMNSLIIGLGCVGRWKCPEWSSFDFLNQWMEINNIDQNNSQSRRWIHFLSSHRSWFDNLSCAFLFHRLFLLKSYRRCLIFLQPLILLLFCYSGARIDIFILLCWFGVTKWIDGHIYQVLHCWWLTDWLTDWLCWFT